MLCPAEEVFITEVWGQGRGRGGEIPSSPDNLFMAICSSDKDYLDNSRSYFRGALFSDDPWKTAHNHQW